MRSPLAHGARTRRRVSRQYADSQQRGARSSNDTQQARNNGLGSEPKEPMKNNKYPKGIRTLREIREANKITPKMLCTKLGISHTTLSNLETLSHNLNGVHSELVEEICDEINATEDERLAALYVVRKFPSEWEAETLTDWAAYRKRVQ
jgi:hypothetical protein